MYRKDLTEEELLEYIAQVKEATADTTVETNVDAYYEFRVTAPTLQRHAMLS